MPACSGAATLCAETDGETLNRCAEKEKKTKAKAADAPGATILNPKTGRFVLRSGAVGMRILLERAGVRSVQSESEESEESEESDGEDAGVPVRKRTAQEVQKVSLLAERLAKKPKLGVEKEVEVEVSQAYAKLQKKKKVRKLWKKAAHATRCSARFKLAATRAANAHTGLSLAFDDLDMFSAPDTSSGSKLVSTTDGSGKKVKMLAHSKAASTKDIAGSSHSKAKYLPPKAHKTALRFLPKKVQRSLNAVKEESEDSD
jgi:hypothetical protein